MHKSSLLGEVAREPHEPSARQPRPRGTGRDSATTRLADRTFGWNATDTVNSGEAELP
jgi:hypothetical protein